MKEITSTQNPFVKSIIQLQEKAKARKKSNQFIIEGLREIELAHKGGYVFSHVLFDSSKIEKNKLNAFITNQTECISISTEVYEKVAYRESTEGIIAVSYSKPHQLSDLNLPENPLILIAESLEKPGNLGALLRTADAANIDAVLIADPKTDMYNPNIVRSSVGCLFTCQIGIGSTDSILEFLNQKKISLYSATLQNSNAYHLENYTTASAIAVGTEATGLTEKWRTQSTKNIVIPMSGKIDSMNVSVAAAILLFEAKRQRGF